MSTPDWMNQEGKQAKNLQKKGRTSNPSAPQMVMVKREPVRKASAFYIQPSYKVLFDRFALEQKEAGGAKPPALAEEALLLLFKKYNVDTSSL